MINYQLLVCQQTDNVSQAGEVEALIDKAVEAYGRLDYAFNNAGIEGTPFVNTAATEPRALARVGKINRSIPSTEPRASARAA